MCVGVESYRVVANFLMLTVIPDAVSCIALRVIKANEAFSSPIRGLTISALTSCYAIFVKDDRVTTAALLYRTLIDIKAVYDIAKIFLPVYLEYQEAEDDIALKLSIIDSKLKALNEREIRIRPYSDRYKRLAARFSRVSPETIVDIYKDAFCLYNDLNRYYDNKMA